MPTLSGHLTRLEAINDMLASIGETPIMTGDVVEEAEIAGAQLDKASRKVQLPGWHSNTLRGLELSKDANNRFVLPDDTLKVDTADPRGTRRTGSPPTSSHIDAVMRRSDDDTQWILFDRSNNTELWTDVTSLTVDIVQLHKFENLVPSLQQYVVAVATRRFQTENMGSRVIYAFTQVEVEEALEQAIQDDTETEDPNLLRDSPTIFDMTRRNNYLWGR